MASISMWYVVDILFAQKASVKAKAVQCELCNVLFEAPSAKVACQKAIDWAKEHERDNNYHYVGIQHVHSIEEERPGEGTEVGGSFFEEDDFWERIDEFIPDPNDIPILKLEENPNTPVKFLISEEKKSQMKKVFGEE